MSKTNDSFAHLSEPTAEEDRPRQRTSRHARLQPGDYEVGYGRPPVGNRFRKGQSGNPKGRPKKQNVAQQEELDIAEILRRVISMPVNLRIGGKAIRMAAIEAMLTGLQSDALKRDKGAMRELRHYIERYHVLPERSSNTDQQHGVLLVREPPTDPTAWEERYGRTLPEYQERVRKEWEDKYGPVSGQGKSRNG